MLEIILIDDGSSDGSELICDQWQKKDLRIRVLHQKNAGVSSARNAGLRICTGDLITFVDADDWLALTMIEKLVTCLTENNSDAALCGFVDYPYGKPVESGILSAPPCGFSGAIYQIMRRYGYSTIMCAKLFRRELVFRNGQPMLFDQSLDCGEDEVWILQVLRYCNTVSFVPEALYFWRTREGSATQHGSVTDKQLSVLNAKQKTLLLVQDYPHLYRLAKARMYNECISLKVTAYCTGNKSAFQILTGNLRSAWWDWFCSPEIKLRRKLKLMIIEAEILCRLPAKVVRKTFALTH